MKLIVGLGNPGTEYEATRHNVGFRVVEAFASKFRIRIATHEKDAFTGTGRVAGQSIMVAMPQTYMNLSGSAVRSLVQAYVNGPEDLLVVYDDIDLPLGRLRIREHGSAGTHNGMKSIVASLGTDRFPRLRFGIQCAPDKERGRLRDYVLDRFDDDEEPAVAIAIDRAVDALVLFARGELKRAMTVFNREPEPPAKQEPSQ